jgi:MYXO-CTERM domain-containing protein
MKRTTLGSLAAATLLGLAAPAAADVAVTGVTTTVDFTGYAGEGFDPDPAAGQLDSDDWRVQGLENGDVQFGGTGVGAGIANGLDPDGVTAGGTWAFDVGGGNAAFGWQPTSLNLTPGNFTLRAVNGTGGTITQVKLAYSAWVFNDQDRSNDLRFSYSFDDVTYIPAPGCTLVTTAAKDAAPAWQATPCEVIAIVSWPADTQLYVRWDTNDVGGMLNRDQLAIDDIVIEIPGCGDGLVAGEEACDDDNNTDGDGCSAACAIEEGWEGCTGQPSVCTPICGDALVVGDEQCDDGDLDDNDGCAGTCEVEIGYACEGEPSVCTPICGDGLIRFEACDDGDTDDGDGCSSVCAAEEGWECTPTEPSVCTSICGDGLVRGLEGCDDGDLVDGDGCTAACTIDAGWACDLGEPSTCAPVCGDSMVTGDEQCDDGGTTDDDGCDVACQLEAGWDCNKAGCTAICGDGLVVGAEECDDDNIDSGDGCSATCTSEAPIEDRDGDTIPDADDNCPDDANTDQADADDDGEGDVCDDDPELPGDDDGSGGGCCQTDDGAGGSLLLAALVLGLATIRRRRRVVAREVA